jgi:hypothetical protein
VSPLASRTFAALAALAPLAALAALAVSPACLPPDAPPQAPAPADPDAALVHAWRIDAHLLRKHNSLTDADAERYRGRTVSISATGYSSTWHGTCEESGRTRRERPLAEVAAELTIDRPRLLQLGFADPLTEHKLSCNDPERRVPVLTVYLASSRALTCYSGACYVLVR